MILAAGLGTRLAPLSSWRAKALMPLGDRPLLSHLASKLQAAGLERIVVNAHHRADEISELVQGTLSGVRVSQERELLGTAGGIERAKTLLGEGDVVVWNGDIVAEIDLRALMTAHTESNAEATLVVRICPKNEGNVGIDASGSVVRLRRETTREGEISGAEFLGIHLLGAELRQLLPEAGCLVGDLYLPALRRGEKLGVLRFAGEFFDIGTPKAYLEASLAWLRRNEGRFWSGKGARIGADVEIESSIVGDGARVSGKGALRRSVIWPGASATAPLEDSIVTPHGTVCVG